MSESLKKIDESIQEVLNNKYISTVIVMFITLYAGLAAPKLPRYWSSMFDSQLFKLFVLFVIGYMATKNYSIAIISALAFLITMNTMQKHKINDQIVSILIVEPTTYDPTAQMNNNLFNDDVNHLRGQKYSELLAPPSNQIHTEIELVRPSKEQVVMPSKQVVMPSEKQTVGEVDRQLKEKYENLPISKTPIIPNVEPVSETVQLQLNKCDTKDIMDVEGYEHNNLFSLV